MILLVVGCADVKPPEQSIVADERQKQAALDKPHIARWTRSPSITVVANGDDPRIELVEEAITFWNKTLEEIGSGFRLGALTRVDQPVPEGALGSLSQSVLAGRGGSAFFPQ